MTLAYFGIESSGLNLVINLVIVFLLVVWFSLIYWTYTDARRRIADPMLIGCAVAASIFPFVGTMVYVILRPPEYLEDVHEREVEMQAAEVRLAELKQSLCPHCDYPVERDFLRCPSCLRKLKERCVSCSRPLDPAWTICPFCESEVPGAIAPRRPRRRGAALEEEDPLETALQEAPSEAVSRRESRARERARRRSGTVALSGAEEPPLEDGAPSTS